MICIVKITDGAVSGWMIAADLPSARRRAEAGFQPELAQHLYRMEFDPPPGKYDLPGGFTMLVD